MHTIEKRTHRNRIDFRKLYRNRDIRTKQYEASDNDDGDKKMGKIIKQQNTQHANTHSHHTIYTNTNIQTTHSLFNWCIANVEKAMPKTE